MEHSHCKLLKINYKDFHLKYIIVFLYIIFTHYNFIFNDNCSAKDNFLTMSVDTML
jgi:hypothetical protein